MHALSIASCSWHYGSFILLAGLIWQVLSFYHVWKIPAVSSGCRALSGPAQFLHWLRRDCPPYYSMLSNARFAAGAFFISCLLFFFCHLLSAKQAPGAPYAVTAFQSLSHCCRPGCRVTCPQAPFVTRASCAFRSSKTRFKNWLFTSRNCLCQYMPWPEKAIVLPRQQTLVKEFPINSDPCHGVAVTLTSLCDDSNRKTPSVPQLAGLWNTGTALELGHWQLSRY